MWTPKLTQGVVQYRPLASYGLPPPPRGNFVDHVFLIAYYLASILQHASPLAMGALPSNIRYPYKNYNTIGNY